MNMPGVSSLIWFAAVVALIPFALRMLKRTPMGGMAAHGAMRVVAVLPLSTQQRLVTLEVGRGDERRWLVLGVTAHGITTLHTMPPQEDHTTGDSAAPTFAPWLERLRQNKGPQGGR